MRKALFALMLLVMAAPVQAQTSAPAAPAPAAAKPAWMSYQSPYAGEENNLANPHRTSEEMISWAQQTAAELLSFGPNDYQAKTTTGFKKYFNDKGWDLYSAYLKDSKVLNKVTDEKYSVGAVVDSAPEILNGGASGDSYHWIIKTPVTLSFFTLNADGTPHNGPSGKYILFMDIERVAQSSNDDGIAINNWRVDDAPKN